MPHDITEQRVMELAEKYAWLIDSGIPAVEIEYLAREFKGEVGWPLDYPSDAPADKDERWAWLCAQGKRHRIWKTAGGTTLEVVK